MSKREKKEKKPRLRARLFMLYIGSFLASAAPVAACVVARWDVYTATPAMKLKLCGGGVIAAVLMLLKVLGKLRIPRRIVFFGAVFVMSYLLEAVLNDLMLLSGLALLGEGLDLVFFQGAIKHTEEAIKIQKTASATADQLEKTVEKVIERYIPRV